MVAVNNPRDETVEKVRQALRKSMFPLSVWRLREIAQTNWDSVRAILDILIERGYVREIPTSNGTYFKYDCIV